MNYRKTKTMQNNRTMLSASALSYMLLFFLLVSCGIRKHADDDNYPKPTNETEKHNKQIHEELMGMVGGIGPCTDECLGKNFVELAINNKKIQDIEGVKSHVIPSKDNDNKPILKSIIEESFVGDKEGKRKWLKWRKRQQQKGRKVREGITGVIGEMLTLISSSKGQHRDPIIYTAFLLMELRTKIDQVPNWTKTAMAAHISKAFADFEEKLKSVAPEANGVRIIIPVDAPKFTFQMLTEVKKSKKHQRPYKLPENLYKDLMVKYNQLKETVKVAEERLS
jgi:hypothetical protein